MNSASHKPNLFIIGAMKSGTSSLHLYLDEHPDIFMCQPKEPSYFVESSQLKDYWKLMWEKNYWQKEENYLSLFKDAQNFKIIGESSTTYTKYPRLTGVAQRIKVFNPHAKFIYIMRDPVERTISHYWHTVRWEKEKRTPVQAIKNNRHLQEVSYYAMQLKLFLEIFGKDQIYILTIEEFQNDPENKLSLIFEWLGVKKDFMPFNLKKKDHVTPEEIHKIRGLGLLNKFRHSNIWDAINPIFPKWIKQAARQFSDPPVKKNAINMEDVMDFLRNRQIDETEELVKLLGRDFPEWKTLYG